MRSEFGGAKPILLAAKREGGGPLFCQGCCYNIILNE